MKQEPCKFCDFKNTKDNRILLNEGSVGRSGMTLSMISYGPRDGAILRMRKLTDDLMLVDSEDAISINYCPFCGRPIAIGKAKTACGKSQS